MKKTDKNQFVLKGEVAEILSDATSVKARVMCRPGTLLIEVASLNEYELGDEVLITGNFTCNKIENLNNFSTNQ